MRLTDLVGVLSARGDSVEKTGEYEVQAGCDTFRQIGPKIVARCKNGIHDTDAILAHWKLARDDLIVANPPPARAIGGGAAEPAKEFVGSLARAAVSDDGGGGLAIANGNGHSNGNGYLPRPSLKDFKDRLLTIAFRCLHNVPFYKDRAVPARELLEPLIEDMRVGVNTLIAQGILPPAELGEGDLQEECEVAARVAIESWSGTAIWSKEQIPGIPTVEQQRSELPELISPNITIISGRELLERRRATVREWVVDGFLARKEISLWSGKVEAGKTTLMRTLVMCVSRGEFFLERHTMPGRILYVMLDADGEDLTIEEFLKLGWNPDTDGVDFIIDPIMALRPNSFEQFHQKLLETKPALVVIDTLGRFQKIEDFLGYETTYAMARFSELAKLANTHIALLHHIPRGRNDRDDAATAGFGSIAIAGGCNARFVCVKKPGNIYTLMTSKGKGGGFRPFDGEQTLARNEETHWITLQGAYSFKDQARGIKDRVLEIINSSDDPMTAQQIATEAGVQRSIAGTAANMLYGDGLIRREVQGKNHKHIFMKRSEQGELMP